MPVPEALAILNTSRLRRALAFWATDAALTKSFVTVGLLMLHTKLRVRLYSWSAYVIDKAGRNLPTEEAVAQLGRSAARRRPPCDCPARRAAAARVRTRHRRRRARRRRRRRAEARHG